MASRKLLLFDIDGTLVDSGGAGMASLGAAARRAFAEAVEASGLPSIELAGSTDWGILKELFAHLGVPETPETTEHFYGAYLEELESRLKAPRSRGRLLPGTQRLLDAIRRETMHITGLLTGNIRRGAFMKIAHFGIDHHFKFGAFGDDHHDRDRLGPVALRRAMDHCGFSFEPGDVIVIGDTPRDIACARAIQARALVVATGSFSRAQLEAHRPHHLFEDFEDTGSVLAAIEGF
jgi:phosphoglycolate phosphatase-like HAD superfamily hydrolase